MDPKWYSLWLQQQYTHALARARVPTPVRMLWNLSTAGYSTRSRVLRATLAVLWTSMASLRGRPHSRSGARLTAKPGLRELRAGGNEKPKTTGEGVAAEGTRGGLPAAEGAKVAHHGCCKWVPLTRTETAPWTCRTSHGTAYTSVILRANQFRG